MHTFLKPPSPALVDAAPQTPPRTTLYANDGHAVSFRRLPTDRLLRHSAVAACLAWEGAHRPLSLSAPALNWLAQARARAHDDGVLLTPPPVLAMELHDFAETFCAPRLARAAQRTLADQLSIDNFAAVWCLALRQDLTATRLDARCMTWSLQHHAALVRADVFGRLQHDDPEAHRAWVMAALQRMATASPADWRAHEAVFVGVLRQARRLALPIDGVALPDIARVAGDDLRLYQAWVLEQPVWEAVPQVVRHYTGHRVVDRNDYIAELLARGVSTAAFTDLARRMDPAAQARCLQLVTLLPRYAGLGNIEIMTWLRANLAPRNADDAQEAYVQACLQALHHHCNEAVVWLLDAFGPQATAKLVEQHGARLARVAATSSLQVTTTIMAMLHGHGVYVDPGELLYQAVAGGRIDVARHLLGGLTSETLRQALDTPPGAPDPLLLAMRKGNVAMVRLFVARLEASVDDPAQIDRMLESRLDAARETLPWESPATAEARLRGRLAILLDMLPRMGHLDPGWFEFIVGAPLLKLAAAAGDLDAVHRLLAPQWPQHGISLALHAWVAAGAGLAGVQAILRHLPKDLGTALVCTEAPTLTQEAVRGGDVATLQWLIATAAQGDAHRKALYRDAFACGSTLLHAARMGHGAMVRFWLKTYADGDCAASAVAYAGYDMLKDAARSNQPDILDMALACVQRAGVLETVMAEQGADALSFAIQNGHHAMVHSLLALPLSDGTRWAILASDNSPMAWAERGGDTTSMAAMLAWAPAGYRKQDHDLGMSSAIIVACTYNHAGVAHLALAQGGDAAKRRMLAVHSGRVVAWAALRGDVIILEQARRLAVQA